MCNTKDYVAIMHTHIIINHDVGLHLVIVAEEEDMEICEVLDDMIVTHIKNATAGIQEA